MPKKKKKIKKIKNKKLKKKLILQKKDVAKAEPLKRANNLSAEEKPVIKKIKKQVTEKRQYNLKDYVVYPKHGVGKITAIEKATI